MLKALCAYYDCLRKRGDSGLVEDGYSNVRVNCNLVLRADGTIKDILPYVQEEIIGKKVVLRDREEIFPARASVSGISAEYIDHREKYNFGLQWDNEEKTFSVEKNALSAFEKNKEKNVAFLKTAEHPLAKAYVAFLSNWKPQEQTDNPVLIKMGKEYNGAKFIVTLEGSETEPLNRLEEVCRLWEKASADVEESDEFGQCAISGNYAPLARTHSAVSGLKGGLSSGNRLVCFKNTAFESYGKKQSYNSSISVESMKRYTSTLNYLLASQKHKQYIGDMTLLFWANSERDEDPYIDAFTYGLFANDDVAADDALKAVFEKMVQGQTADLEGIDPNTDFYLVGIKPNTSRVAVKIFEKNSFGRIMENLVRHCRDMRFSEEDRQFPLWAIVKELQSPVADSLEDVDLQTKLLLSVLRGLPYPRTMLTTIVRRCKIDHDREDNGKKFQSVNKNRARIIRACLKRQQYFHEEEYSMLQENSQDVAYTLGRLFAALEGIQQDAADGALNATIKDKFFSSACATPNLVFPRLLKLAQAHLAKLDEGKRIYREKFLQDIIGRFDNPFPRTLTMEQQGMFILGYYQQKQKFFEKRIKEIDNNGSN